MTSRVSEGRGGPGDEHALFDERLEWEQHLGASGWNCVGWPKEHGGRGLSLHQQVIWYEEYARAGGPGRLGHIGEGLLGPTIMAFGNEDQQARFLPPIVAGTELWAQGYSEPNAGSDLANVQTRAEPDGDDWRITGQKVWTSLAHWSDWVLRAGPDRPRGPAQAPGHLVLPRCRCSQDGVEIRPIRQVTGTSEFNEVFFDNALAKGVDVVGGVNNGWKVGDGHAGVRARCVHARPADGVPQRARRDRRASPGRTAASTTRSSGSGSPTAHAGSRSCAGTPSASCRVPTTPPTSRRPP